MKISGLNLDIQWKNKSRNFEEISEAFSNETADLFLLPEMFATGFCMEPEEIADRNNETLSWMQNFAAEKNAAVCGSVSVQDGSGFYNRMFFVKPDGTFSKYDKRHLFSFSGEDKVYKSGRERVVVQYADLRILLQVCYDLRFPVFSRNNDDYDVVLYVANWPEKRVSAWEHLLKARAIENLAYVFGLNRIGKDGNGLLYRESSQVFFADGSEIASKNGNIVSVDIDLEKLQDFRTHFRFLDDRDSFKIAMD
ncbi:MAG: nitrilase family protein [Weeksellaceae bacterium]|nr:nitrilase family protein [Weeksellaceae bacterium]